MYKDYMSLEMASFIIRLWVFTPKNYFISPSLWHDCAHRSTTTVKDRVKGKKKIKKMYQDVKNNLFYTYRHVLWEVIWGLLEVKQRVHTQLWVESSLGCLARWREPAVPLDGVRSYSRALGPWQKQDNKSRSEAEDVEPTSCAQTQLRENPQFPLEETTITIFQWPCLI